MNYPAARAWPASSIPRCQNRCPGPRLKYESSQQTSLFLLAQDRSAMFERFTEKARRAVFFARYEASQYGNPSIETEHLLLGLWREDPALRLVLNDPGVVQQGERLWAADSKIRAAIEQAIGQHVGQRAPISTSIELPLSADSKKALLFATEESDR